MIPTKLSFLHDHVEGWSLRRHYGKGLEYSNGEYFVEIERNRGRSQPTYSLAFRHEERGDGDLRHESQLSLHDVRTRAVAYMHEPAMFEQTALEQKA
jgi:hypothetical protein